MSPDADSRHEQGRAIYNFRCYFCHGYSGDAKTLASSYLDPKPRNFQETSLADLSRDTMISVVSKGKAGTAMKGFHNTLSPADIELVVDFVRREFIQNKAPNTRYHTVANGWPDHQRYAVAFPFALGQIALDTPWEQLDESQQQGKRIFMNSCVSCHDRARVQDEGVIWDTRAVSYPRNRYSHVEAAQQVQQQSAVQTDSDSGASPYARHDRAPVLENLSTQERMGEQLFQDNCAFCHAADGTGKNWIGSFLEPHPRNLTDAAAMAGMTRERLRQTIRDGLPGTTMSAWKNVLKPEQIEAIIAYINRAFLPVKFVVQK